MPAADYCSPGHGVHGHIHRAIAARRWHPVSSEFSGRYGVVAPADGQDGPIVGHAAGCCAEGPIESARGGRKRTGYM
eukprot:COSAG01_NODE_10613_length_2119_cov_2.440653_1_plen_77_part_00